jgi:hypothetical protein
MNTSLRPLEMLASAGKKSSRPQPLHAAKAPPMLNLMAASLNKRRAARGVKKSRRARLDAG